MEKPFCACIGVSWLPRHVCSGVLLLATAGAFGCSESRRNGSRDAGSADARPAREAGQDKDARPLLADVARDAGGNVVDAPIGDGPNDQSTDAFVRDGEAGENRSPVCTCPTPMVETNVPIELELPLPGCTDPDGDPLFYEWSAVEQPFLSMPAITLPQTEQPRLVLDRATTPEEPYVFHVTVSDPSGASAGCDTTVFAPPRGALYVESVWDRDATNVDLHFLNPIGSADPSSSWFDVPNDCFAENWAANWGDPQQTFDDASLLINVVSGVGPEVIRLDSPEPGIYTAGVHYYCDADLGPTTATVRIFCSGALVAQVSAVLPASGSFVEAASVEWPSCNVQGLAAPSPVGATLNCP
jgi:hypothetical protein